MIHQVKAFATKALGLSLVAGTHKRREPIPTCYSLTSTCMPRHVHISKKKQSDLTYSNFIFNEVFEIINLKFSKYPH